MSVFFEANFTSEIYPVVDGERVEAPIRWLEGCSTGELSWVWCVGVSVTLPVDEMDDTAISFVELENGEIVGHSDTHTARGWGELG
ncbi:hypothetical protein [Microbacterium sp. ZW T5_56]|uniref:hypothetical protein n=1 Tax=Microbacterium sp. ZW T5_56 TaxID=3378081 RepID=UPI0038552CC3